MKGNVNLKSEEITELKKTMFLRNNHLNIYSLKTLSANMFDDQITGLPFLGGLSFFNI